MDWPGFKVEENGDFSSDWKLHGGVLLTAITNLDLYDKKTDK